MAWRIVDQLFAPAEGWHNPVLAKKSKGELSS